MPLARCTIIKIPQDRSNFAATETGFMILYDLNVMLTFEYKKIFMNLS